MPIPRGMKIYVVRYHGIDGKVTKYFATLKEVQAYVKDRWEGMDYYDGPAEFHNDYGYFVLDGCVLAQLGDRDPKDPWSWIWKEL